MASENEMLADIIAELREHDCETTPPFLCFDEDGGVVVGGLADRIEAAWKREREPKPLTIPEWIDHEESIADIAAVLRRYVLPSLADRLEAATKRERESLLTKQGENVNSGSAVYTGENKGGNAAAMREALLAWLNAFDEFVQKPRNGKWPQNPCGTLVLTPLCAAKLVDMTNSALSAPPRNCDVGTAEEQAERMSLFCKNHGVDESGSFRCEKCPFLSSDKCELSWAQMPYEAEEGGAE